jgi:hypothetical protein
MYPLVSVGYYTYCILVEVCCIVSNYICNFYKALSALSFQEYSYAETLIFTLEPETT